ncbi:hypothetical protein AMTR_s00127p00030520 [Amborella trichopoda]|uniref:Uncharacterized protein n=1 Tax=Amborella trichopoda TaxID=13333 RepID=W1NRM9_AMBTC|nr:hypothetical protein AMTR_s00127p00030520 [Amborella trichopoda]
MVTRLNAIYESAVFDSLATDQGDFPCTITEEGSNLDDDIAAINVAPDTKIIAPEVPFQPFQNQSSNLSQMLLLVKNWLLCLMN